MASPSGKAKHLPARSPWRPDEDNDLTTVTRWMLGELFEEVTRLELGVVGQDLRLGLTAGESFQNLLNHDPAPANAGFAERHVRIDLRPGVVLQRHQLLQRGVQGLGHESLYGL